MAGEEIWFERRKWPATPHYGHPARIVGEDAFGLWCEVRATDKWYRGESFLFDGPFNALVLVAATNDFIAWFWPPSLVHGELDLYVDIVTGIERTETSLTAIDLDFDVIRFRDDQRVELVDEDEFLVHQVELAYPDEIVAHATRTAAGVEAAVRAGIAPFDAVAACRWIERIH